MVDPSSNLYTVPTMFFDEYGGGNVGVTNLFSHFYMLVPTRSNVKFSDEKMGHAQVIGIISC